MNNMKFKRKLPIPKDLKAMYPASDEMLAVKNRRAEEIRNIFSGDDSRFLLVIGPCSADNPEADAGLYFPPRPA